MAKKKTTTPTESKPSPWPVDRMLAIEQEVRRASIVKENSLVIIKDATGDSLDCAVLFLQKGDNTVDAVALAQEMGGVRHAHVHRVIPLNGSIDLRDDDVDWLHVYLG
jgi:hypothetical protein